jgi:hypothetical protein
MRPYVREWQDRPLRAHNGHETPTCLCLEADIRVWHARWARTPITLPGEYGVPICDIFAAFRSDVDVAVANGPIDARGNLTYLPNAAGYGLVPTPASLRST